MGQRRSTQTTKTRLSERTTKTAARPTPFPQSLSPGCRELQPQILPSATPSLHVAPDALDRTDPQGCVSQQRRGRAPVVTHGVAPGTQNMEQLFTQTKFLGRKTRNKQSTRRRKVHAATCLHSSQDPRSRNPLIPLLPASPTHARVQNRLPCCCFKVHLSSFITFCNLVNVRAQDARNTPFPALIPRPF